MNKTELVTAMMNKTGLTKKDTEATLNAFMDIVCDAMKKRDKIQLTGFMTLRTEDKPAREMKNPVDTSKIIKVPAKTVVKAKMGSRLKDI